MRERFTFKLIDMKRFRKLFLDNKFTTIFIFNTFSIFFISYERNSINKITLLLIKSCYYHKYGEKVIYEYTHNIIYSYQFMSICLCCVSFDKFLSSLGLNFFLVTVSIARD